MAAEVIGETVNDRIYIFKTYRHVSQASRNETYPNNLNFLLACLAFKLNAESDFILVLVIQYISRAQNDFQELLD